MTIKNTYICMSEISLYTFGRTWEFTGAMAEVCLDFLLLQKKRS